MSTPLPDPSSAPELFDGVLQRRMLAYCVDLAVMLVITVIVLIVGSIAGLVTFGALFLALPFAVPLAIVLYYAATLGSHSRATVGMRMFDIVLTPTRGTPLNGWKAFAHPLIFWITCWVLLPFNLLVALFTPRRQMIHDLLTGTLMVRRSPMELHWAQFARS